eukprot:COSAG02_NODE_21935_length_769_cov_9.356716_1_plen_87_part_10
MRAGAWLMVALALVSSTVSAVASDGGQEAVPRSAPVMSTEHVLKQLEQAGSDVTKIAAVIASAKDAGLPDDEMETVRRAAQRAILGD